MLLCMRYIHINRNSTMLPSKTILLSKMKNFDNIALLVGPIRLKMWLWKHPVWSFNKGRKRTNDHKVKK